MRKLVAMALLATLVACGGDGGDEVNDQDRQVAEDFCASEGEYAFGQGMGIDRYENPDGFDRCVEDASTVTECLDAPAEALEPWVPPDCENDGYM